VICRVVLIEAPPIGAIGGVRKGEGREGVDIGTKGVEIRLESRVQRDPPDRERDDGGDCKVQHGDPAELDLASDRFGVPLHAPVVGDGNREKRERESKLKSDERDNRSDDRR